MNQGANKRRALAAGIFFLFLSFAHASWAAIILIVSAEPFPTANQIAARTNLVSTLEGDDHTVEVMDTVPTDLSRYAVVWDIRAVVPLTDDERTRYFGYLEDGGRLVLIGENNTCTPCDIRNGTIVSLVELAAGGTLTLQDPAPQAGLPQGRIRQKARAPFTGPDLLVDGDVIYAGPGGVTNPGKGRVITADLANIATGLFFGPGSLGKFPNGTLVVMFDLNFLENDGITGDQFDYDPDDDDQKLLRNIIGELFSPSAPPQTIGNVIPNAGRPYGVAVHNGFAYVADPESHTVWKFELSNPANKTAVAGIGWNPEVDPLDRAGYNGDGIDALGAQLSNPSAVAIDSAGNVYIADRGNHAIRKIAADSSFITTVAGIPTSYAVGESTHPACESGVGDLSQCVPATNLRLFGPRALAVDEDDNVYIVDEMNYQVKKLYTNGTLAGHIFVVAGVAGQPGSNDGPANGPVSCVPNEECRAGARLNAPAGVAVSGSTVYIADSGNNKIRTVSDGEVQTLEVGSLLRPTGVAANGDIVYIANYGNHRIVRARNCGGEGCDVVTIVGTGEPGSSGGAGSPGTDVQLNSPISLTLDGVLLYIADMLNGRVLSGNFTPPVITLQ